MDNLQANEHYSFRNRHADHITGLKFDKFKLISYSLDTTIRIWNLLNKKCEAMISCDEPVKNIDLFNHIIFALSENKFARYMDEPLLQEYMQIKVGQANVLQVRFDGIFLGRIRRISFIKPVGIKETVLYIIFKGPSRI